MTIRTLSVVFTLAAWFILMPTALAQDESKTPKMEMEAEEQQMEAEEQQFEQQIAQQVQQQTGLPAQVNVDVERNPQGNLIPMQGEITVTVPNAATPAPAGGEGSTLPLPPSGGLPVSTMLLPAAALLLGLGVLAYSAALRRRK